MRLTRPVHNGRKLKHWYVVWSDGQRSRRRSTGCRDRVAAEAWMQRFNALRSAPVGEKSVLDICSAYLDARIAEGVKAPDTIMHTLKPISAHFGGLRPGEINAAYVRGYMLERKRIGRAGPTIGKELRQLRAALRWAEREGWIDRAPAIAAPGENAPRDRWLSREEFERADAACKSPHVRAFLYLGVYTGARKSRITALTWPRIDFGAGMIWFPTSEAGATKRISPKPMHDRLAAVLRKTRDWARTPHVIEYNGEHVTQMTNAFRRTLAAAGCPDVTIHDLRRTCAVWMLHGGASMSQVAKMLDDSVRTCERHYAHHDPNYLRSAVEGM